MKISTFLPAFLFVALVPSLLFSQQAPYRFDDIIVTASRIESPLKEAPANVTVITAEEIAETGAQTIGDAVQREAGVFTQNLLGNPKSSNIDIRGYGESAPQNVLFLVNGRRVNGIDLTGPDLAQIPIDAIERIEILRGPGTVLYGDNATGGVVNIILKSGGGPPVVVGSATVGSYNYFKPELLISGKEGKFSYFSALSDTETQGYRHNNHFYAKDGLANFDFEMGSRLQVQVAAGLHSDDYGMPGTLFWSDLRKGIVDRRDATLSYVAAKGSTDDNFIDLGPQVKLGDDLILDMGASYRNRRISSSFDYGSGNYFLTRGQLRTQGFTPRLTLTRPVGSGGRNVLVVGSDWYNYSTDATSSTAFFGSPSLTRNDVEKRDLAFYVDNRFYPTTDLLIETGYRRQRSKYEFENRDLLHGVAEDDLSSRYNREAYRIAVSYALFRTNLFASLSQGFRFPATDEVISWGYYDSWTGTYVPTKVNTSLKPQTTRELDAGIRFAPWSRLSGAITFFCIQNRDEIYYNPLTYANENYDRTRRRGVETSLFLSLLPALALNLNHSYIDASFDGGTFDGNRIPLVPQNKFSARLSYTAAQWDVSLSSIYTGNRYAISDQENIREKLPGYTTFDAALGYRIGKLSALLSVKNLTDRKYSEIGTYSVFRNDIGLYPSPGRQFFLTLTYALGG